MTDNPQFVGGREYWSCVGEHISEAFVRGYADLLEPIAPKVADDLRNIAEHSNRLAIENKALQIRDFRSLEETRMKYFLRNWPVD